MRRRGNGHKQSQDPGKKMAVGTENDNFLRLDHRMTPVEPKDYRSGKRQQLEAVNYLVTE